MQDLYHQPYIGGDPLSDLSTSRSSMSQPLEFRERSFAKGLDEDDDGDEEPGYGGWVQCFMVLGGFRVLTQGPK